MTKAQVAAAMFVGGAISAGGQQIANSILNSAEAKGRVIVVHAVDLRRPASMDAGVSVLVYGTQQNPDGGDRDLGRPMSCKPSVTTSRAAESVMNKLGEECVWQ